MWDCVKPVAGGLREKWDDNVSSFEIVQSITDVSVSAVASYPGCVICSILSCGNTLTSPLTSVGKRNAMQTSQSSLGPGRKQYVSEKPKTLIRISDL